MDWQPGTQLGNGTYLLEQVLGKGGFGITYKAHHSDLKACVVIKTTYEYKRNDSEYDKYVQQFVREGQKMEKLSQQNHPHIVRVRHFFWENDRPCLVMDYIPGENLFEAVNRRGNLPEAEAICCMRQIGDALSAIHNLGLVHRDLHPGNIILKAPDNAVLIDFGFAKEIVPSTLSSTGSGGNKSFAPYEQLIKGSRETNVDVYCLAATMYYIVTGKSPTTSFERKFCQTPLTPPQQIVPHLSDTVNRAIIQGMALEPEERPQSMAEWLALLEEPPPPPPKTFSFEVVTVNAKGREIERRRHQASYFTESLGNGVVLEMVAIPGGSFEMGSPDGEGYSDEKPQHLVTVPPFYIAKYPITQAQYRAITGKNPSRFQGDKRPVEGVSWYDAIEFCQKLSKIAGKTYRLPSEAEWEYACRAGTTTPFSFGATITTDLANYNGNNPSWGSPTYADEPKGKYREQTTDVGSFPPNAFGLYDLHGNVWEWCEDDWHDSYQGAPTDGRSRLNQKDSQQVGSKVTANAKSGVSDDSTPDNTNDKISQLKLLRGGSWYNNPSCCRSAIRYRLIPGNRNDNIGFRVVVV